MAGTGVSSSRIPAPSTGPATVTRLRQVPFEAKLRPPSLRPGMVERTRLVERLLASDAPIVAVVAAAGYGKSALVDQWVSRTSRHVAWLSLDDDDNDPAVLLDDLRAALESIEQVQAAAVQVRAVPGASVAAVVARRVAATLASIDAPVTVVIDNDEAVRNHQCRDAIGELAVRLPPNAQLVVVSRTAPTLPLPALRARGAVLEIGAEDLAMDADEAAELLDGAGVTLSDSELGGLVAATEGWPVGLYLAALAHRAGGSVSSKRFAFAGDDRHMADYLRTEVLARIPRGRQQFLLRTSVLDRLSGPLCDEVLGTRGCASTLQDLEASNLLLVPLDRRRAWYRYHPLFRQLLRAELDRLEPERVPGLHARAAAWHDAHAGPDAAIAHAQASGDTDLVARLVAEHVLAAYTSGRLTTVTAWLDWFDEREVLGRYPAVAVLGAAAAALMGQPAAAERRAAVAARDAAAGTVPDGSTFESWLAVVRAMLCRRGIDEMRRDARIALEGMAPDSRWRATALSLAGMAWLLGGELDRAERTFADAVDIALDQGAYPAGVSAMAGAAVTAIGRGEWPRAREHAERALAVVDERRIGDHVPSALVFAVAARIAARDGDLAATQDHLARAARLRPQLTHALPFYAVQTHVELAASYLSLADPGGARTVLREAADVLRVRPDLGRLNDQVAELRTSLESFEVGVAGASSLTAAELRLVPLLSTHLSFPEIGERLYISRHTVKTQAVSLYRKLGVSSRSGAIECLDGLGLLGT